ncbi:MAG: cell division protein ZipA C-terminal FtsZ-binding domain-containing protein [Gammaproteobacteria bacterium]
MSALQWALLLLGVGIAAGLIWSSWRDKRAVDRLNAPAPRPVSRDWSAPEVSAASEGQGQAGFDEFGVSKPRKAVAGAPTRTAPTVTPVHAPAPAPPHAGAPAVVIGLYIAEHEGTNILGPRIHAALQSRGLRFGAKRIYHRFDGEHAIFSVASLVKPGELDPDAAEGFATPGLSVFMQLPGPLRPVAAFQDMLDTARGLAQVLKAELYDSEQRAPLTPERERALHEQVEAWARRHTASGRLGA